MNKIVPTMLAIADLLIPVTMFRAASSTADRLADQIVSSRYGISPWQQSRPDIAEAIAQGEYTIMQRTSRSAGFYRRAALLRFQQPHSR